MNAPGFLTTTSSRDYTVYTVRKLGFSCFSKLSYTIDERQIHCSLFNNKSQKRAKYIKQTVF